MKTYIIIDQLGAKHGTVKAASASDAKSIFCGKSSLAFRDMVFAISQTDLKSFIDNLNLIS